MSIDLNKAPYYDDFDPSKQYTQILAVPETVAQARDFTQAQTIMLYMLKKLSSAILKEGSIVSGMSYSISSGTITVEDGRVYINGIVHDFKKQTIPMSGVGEENICINLETSIVTEIQDDTLRDPVIGSANYQQPGAHRVKMVPVLCRNVSNAPTIYKFRDGLLVIDNQKPQLDIITDLLARRTFDEAGNYKVSGLTMSVKPYDDNKVQLTVESGKAYIKGYEVTKPAPHVQLIDKSKLIRSVIGEVKVYHNGTNLYQLNNDYAKWINQVIGRVSVTETVTRGSVGNGMDSLSHTPVVSVQSVSQGSTNYISGTNYLLTGDKVDWSPGGPEPAIGTTYTVTYTYSKVMISGVDYKLTNSGSKSYLDFSPEGDNPVDGSDVSLSYDYYLGRKDRVLLGYDGSIVVLLGQSDLPELTLAPKDSDSSYLSLGIITHLPNDDNPVVYNQVVTRVSMEDMTSILNRLDNLEYNIALGDLDNEAMQGESPTNLKGIFTDGFLGFSKCDLSHPLYSAAINMQDNRLEQSCTYTSRLLQLDSLNSSNVSTFGSRGLSMLYTDETLVSQPFATDRINVNPFSTFPALSSVRLYPSVDNWIDESRININSYDTKTEYVSWWWYRRSETEYRTSSSSYTTDSIIEYARPQTITIEGNYFPPNMDNLICTIDGAKVLLTPSYPTVAGTTSGSIKTNSSGYAKATFNLPSGTRTGNRNITLSNGVASASAIFSSMGIHRTTITNNLTTAVTKIGTDPAAETFQLSQNRFVTKAKIYFATKSSSLPVHVSIRNTVNGYPGTETLAEVTIPPSQVQTSSNGTVPTVVTFDTPAYCEAGTQYCIVVATESSEYQIFVATLGHKSLTSQDYMLGQPYIAGSLFISSNAATWTPVQESDMKFELIGARFPNSATAVFQPITKIDYDRLVLAADYLASNGSNCIWEYKTSVTGEWLPIDSYVCRDLPSVCDHLQVRARMSSDGNITPMIMIDNIKTMTGVMNTNGVYISKLVTTSQPFTTVKQVVEAYIPSKSTVEVQLSIDNSTWVSGTLVSTDPIDNIFNRYTYTYTIPASASSTKFRSRINLKSTTRTSKPVVSKILNILK